MRLGTRKDETQAASRENATARNSATVRAKHKGRLDGPHGVIDEAGTPPAIDDARMRKRGTYTHQEAATAAAGASSSRSCRTTELRVGASSSFNLRSQACKIRRFCSSFK